MVFLTACIPPPRIQPRITPARKLAGGAPCNSRKYFETTPSWFFGFRITRNKRWNLAEVRGSQWYHSIIFYTANRSRCGHSLPLANAVSACQKRSMVRIGLRRFSRWRKTSVKEVAINLWRFLLLEEGIADCIWRHYTAVSHRSNSAPPAQLTMPSN